MLEFLHTNIRHTLLSRHVTLLSSRISIERHHQVVLEESPLVFDIIFETCFFVVMPPAIRYWRKQSLVIGYFV